MKYIILALLAITAFSLTTTEYYDSSNDMDCQDECPDNTYFNEATWKCEKIPSSLDNCKIHYYQDDYKHSIVSCSECEEGFMELTVNDSQKHQQTICVENKSKIANCKTYSPSVHHCSVCDDGYVMVKDDDDLFVSCTSSSAVPNCVEYVEAAKASSVKSDGVATAKCSVCKQGYFENSGNCTEVTKIENCRLYSTTSGDCTECNNGFLQQSGNIECTAITALEGCALHQYVTAASQLVCQRCKPTHYLSQKDSKCVTLPSSGVAITENCFQYNQFGSYIYCNACASKFGSQSVEYGLPCQECPTKASGSVILSVSMAVFAILFALL